MVDSGVVFSALVSVASLELSGSGFGLYWVSVIVCMGLSLLLGSWACFGLG